VTCWIKALSDNDAGKRVYTRLKVIDSRGEETFSKPGYTLIASPGYVQLIDKTLSPSDTVIVPSGGRIALEVYWASTTEGNLEVYYGSSTHNSRLTSPPNSPVYPAPELPTIVLLSIGVAGAASISVLKRVLSKRTNNSLN